MTLDEFSTEVHDICDAAQRRLVRAGLTERYREIAVPSLKKIYERHDILGLRTPHDPLHLVAVAFGSVGLAVVRRLKELYFASIGKPSTWPAVVEQCATVANNLEEEIVAEMEQAFAATRPVA